MNEAELRKQIEGMIAEVFALGNAWEEKRKELKDKRMALARLVSPFKRGDIVEVDAWVKHGDVCI